MNRGTQRVIYHRRWQGLGLATGGMVFCLATAAQGQGVVSNGVAMLAKGAVALYPAADARTTVVAELPEGATLQVDPDSLKPFHGREWLAVAMPGHLSAWVYGELAPEGVVAVSGVHVRAGADVAFRSVGEVPKGTRLEVRGRMGEWLRVGPPASARLWVEASLVGPKQDANTWAAPGVAPAGVAETNEFVAGAVGVPPDGKLPAVLKGCLLSPNHVQGRQVMLSGRGDLPDARQWFLPELSVLEVRGGEEPVRYMLATTLPLDELVGAELTVTGTLWWLAGQPLGVLVAGEVVVHPFSLGAP